MVRVAWHGHAESTRRAADIAERWSLEGLRSLRVRKADKRSVRCSKRPGHLRGEQRNGRKGGSSRERERERGDPWKPNSERAWRLSPRPSSVLLLLLLPSPPRMKIILAKNSNGDAGSGLVIGRDGSISTVLGGEVIGREGRSDFSIPREFTSSSKLRAPVSGFESFLLPADFMLFNLPLSLSLSHTNIYNLLRNMLDRRFRING